MSRLPDLAYDQMTADQQGIHDEIVAGPRGAVVGPLKAGCIHRRWPVTRKSWAPTPDIKARYHRIYQSLRF